LDKFPSPKQIQLHLTILDTKILFIRYFKAIKGHTYKLKCDLVSLFLGPKVIHKIDSSLSLTHCSCSWKSAQAFRMRRKSLRRFCR
jgi:hypothetical protein